MSHSLDTSTSTPSSTPSTTDVAKDEARSVGQTTAEAGKQVAGTAAAQAQQVTQEARTQATQLLSQGREQATEQARNGQQKAASSLTALADELRALTNGEGGSGPATDLLRQATDRVESFAGHLQNREPADLLDDVRRFARRRPGAFLLGAAVAGIVAGRLTTGVVAAHKDQNPSGDATARRLTAGTDQAYTGGAAAGYTAVPPVDGPGYTDPAYATGGPGYDPTSGYTPVPPAPYGTAVPAVDQGWGNERPLGGGRA